MFYSPFIKHNFLISDIYKALTREIVDEFSEDRYSYYSSGTYALYDVFRYLNGLNNKKIVVLPAYTCSNVAFAANKAGFLIYLVDINPMDMSMRIDTKLKSKIEQLNSVVITYLFGAAVPEVVFDYFKKNNIYIVEDAAQIFREQNFSFITGEAGDFGIYSFSPSKPLSVFSGGLLRCNNQNFISDFKKIKTQINPIYELIEILLYKLLVQKYIYPFAQKIYMPVILNKMKKSKNDNREISSFKKKLFNIIFSRYSHKKKEREKICIIYEKYLEKNNEIQALGVNLSKHLYPVLIKNNYLREMIVYNFKKYGLETGKMLYKPLYYYNDLKIINKNNNFPGCEEIFKDHLLLPVNNNITEELLNKIF